MYQVAENFLPVLHATSCGRLAPLISAALLHGHQEDALPQEGHVVGGHVVKVVGHQEHLYHSFVGVK